MSTVDVLDIPLEQPSHRFHYRPFRRRREQCPSERRSPPLGRLSFPITHRVEFLLHLSRWVWDFHQTE